MLAPELILLGALLADHTAGAHDAAPSPRAEVQRFRDAAWTEVRQLAAVAPGVLLALRERIGKDSPIADVGGAFDATDVVTGKPKRRLVVAGHSDERWFICYERGGRGHHLVLAMFAPSGGTLRPVLLARGGAGKHDDIRGWQVGLEDLRRALLRGQLEVERRIISDHF